MFYQTKEEYVRQQLKINEWAIKKAQELAEEVKTAKQFRSVVRIWNEFCSVAERYRSNAIYPTGQHDYEELEIEGVEDRYEVIFDIWPWDEVPTFGPDPDMDEVMTWNRTHVLIKDGPMSYVVMSR